MQDSGVGWVLIIISLGIYVLPSIVAFRRDHANSGPIFALNLLLGWTLLGWVAALVWALTAQVPVSGGSARVGDGPDLPADGGVAALERYAALHKEGLLSLAEFEAIKSRLLARGD